MTAYEGQVTVREPKGSWFDPQLLFLYIILAAAAAYAAMGLFSIFFPSSTKPSSKRRGAKKPSAAVTPASPAKASQPAADLSEFLPESMRASGLRARKGALDGPTSEGESGAESAASAGGTRRRSTRKPR